MPNFADTNILALQTEFEKQTQALLLTEFRTDANVSPTLQMVQAMQQIFSICQQFDATEFTSQESSELTDYGLQLLQQLSIYAKQTGLVDNSQALEQLSLDFALLMLSYGVTLNTIESIVNVIARNANQMPQPQQLADYSQIVEKIIYATHTDIQQDLEKSHPQRPWRILLLNYGIICTRSHQPKLMHKAFALIIQHLPEDAQDFFTQGMEQMALLDYPTDIKQIMQYYYQQWTSTTTVH